MVFLTNRPEGCSLVRVCVYMQRIRVSSGSGSNRALCVGSIIDLPGLTDRVNFNYDLSGTQGWIFGVVCDYCKIQIVTTQVLAIHFLIFKSRTSFAAFKFASVTPSDGIFTDAVQSLHNSSCFRRKRGRKERKTKQCSGQMRFTTTLNVIYLNVVLRKKKDILPCK